MTGKRSRSKGQRGEREFAAMATDQLGAVVKRELGQERDGGGDVRIGRWIVQVKRQERARVLEWYRQALADSQTGGGFPVVAWKASGEPWLVVLDARDWFSLVRGDLDDGR